MCASLLCHLTGLSGVVNGRKSPTGSPIEEPPALTKGSAERRRANNNNNNDDAAKEEMTVILPNTMEPHSSAVRPYKI